MDYWLPVAFGNESEDFSFLFIFIINRSSRLTARFPHFGVSPIWRNLYPEHAPMDQIKQHPLAMDQALHDVIMLWT